MDKNIKPALCKMGFLVFGSLTVDPQTDDKSCVFTIEEDVGWWGGKDERELSLRELH